ncbi:hypothetical protein BT3_218 [Staphylococcus phage BT3]|uniref:Uncharacterized protein n=1 Tax=Staphylococcus phage PM22 TaxID=2813339 RepID=A0A8E5K8K0_9CAUD|nr:hypothetical protein PM9_211 [Staphylococcus phage PM9]QVD56451.1 hypothetical protein PM22_206 [Staphylococcus phage PM22]QVD56566.1 hypothetical protein PM25_109 [Staphylococcus phage PM25]QVD56684.1 hypothetical protein PM28_014 [Staphylococcus phage PM28]QVD57530.1 hypothetical protein PM32_216 [Staphylococcus phage PM32]QVD58179.1 hypothetical protein BT3_218 [Staphylococcus phage BT3]QVD58405.1 hypothetical protein PM4_212 [Staphylococcus phage PM4]WPH66889.1 hypothetical protein CU
MDFNLKDYAIIPVTDKEGNIVIRIVYVCLRREYSDWVVDKVYGRQESSETWLNFMQDIRNIDRAKLKIEKWQVT